MKKQTMADLEHELRIVRAQFENTKADVSNLQKLVSVRDQHISQIKEGHSRELDRLQVRIDAAEYSLVLAHQHTRDLEQRFVALNRQVRDSGGNYTVGLRTLA